MDIGKILTELRQEHAHVTEAIISVERLALGSGKRRGRPPAWMVAARSGDAQSSDAPKRRGRPVGSKNRRSSSLKPLPIFTNNALSTRPHGAEETRPFLRVADDTACSLLEIEGAIRVAQQAVRPCHLVICTQSHI